jgi:hypothetical protein
VSAKRYPIRSKREEREILAHVGRYRSGYERGEIGYEGAEEVFGTL